MSTVLLRADAHALCGLSGSPESLGVPGPSPEPCTKDFQHPWLHQLRTLPLQEHHPGFLRLLPSDKRWALTEATTGSKSLAD